MFLLIYDNLNIFLLSQNCTSYEEHIVGLEDIPQDIHTASTSVSIKF